MTIHENMFLMVFITSLNENIHQKQRINEVVDAIFKQIKSGIKISVKVKKLIQLNLKANT